MIGFELLVGLVTLGLWIFSRVEVIGPGRAAAIDPEDEGAFRRQVRERAEEQRRRYRETRRVDPGANQERPGSESPS